MKKIRNSKLEIRNFGRKAAGFSLVELLIYVAVAGIIFSLILPFSWNVFGVKDRVNHAAELMQNGRLAMTRVTQQVRSADDVRTGVGYEVDESSDDFNAGNHNKTQWDDAGKWLELSSPGQTSGSGDFTSRVMDAGKPITWGPLAVSARAPYGKELPDNRGAETGYASGNVSMEGNALLYHFNELSGTLIDYSGQGNHGVNHGAAYGASGRFRNALSFSGGGGTTQVTLYPVADAWIQQNLTANKGNSTLLQIYPRTSYHQRALVRFDLSSIPAGAVISSAKLSLMEAQTYGFPKLISAHRISHDWTEGTGAPGSGVTWYKYDGVNPWGVQGGDFNPSATSTILVYWIYFLKRDEWDVTADVQKFVNGSQINYGWLLKNLYEDNSQWYWFFQSREGTSRPRLNVTYSVPGSYVDAGNASSLMPSRFTVEAWINPANMPGANQYYGIVSKGDEFSHDGYELYIRGSNAPTNPNKIAWGLGGTAVSSKDKPASNKWTHVVGTYDGSLLTLYVNGAFNSSSPAILTANNRPLYIGRRYTDSSHLFNGVLDEVAVYDCALTADEVSDRYKRGVLNLRFQARTDSASPPRGDFVGPNGTSSDYYSEFINVTLGPPVYSLRNLATNRYFQYRAYLATEDPNLTPEISRITLGSRGSSFDVNPGLLLLDAPGEGSDIVIDTYTQEVFLGGQPFTIRTLRMKEGDAPANDLTSQWVNVTNWVVSNRIRSSEAKNIRIFLTLASVGGAPEDTLSLKTSASVRKQ